VPVTGIFIELEASLTGEVESAPEVGLMNCPPNARDSEPIVMGETRVKVSASRSKGEKMPGGVVLFTVRTKAVDRDSPPPVPVMYIA